MSSDQRVPVRTSLTAYRAAIAELAISSRPATASEAAIIVIDGRGAWWDRALDAFADEPLAVIIAEPGAASPERIAALAAKSGACPVVIDRALVRTDVAESVNPGREFVVPRTVVAECSAAQAELAVVVRDALAWLRILSEAPLEVRSAARTARTRVAHLESVDGRQGAPAFLKVDIVDAGEASAFLRVIALGETRSELTVDAAAGRPTVSTGTAAGWTVAPSRYEESARLTLRRTLEALVEATIPTDLSELRQDAELADQIL